MALDTMRASRSYTYEGIAWAIARFLSGKEEKFATTKDLSKALGIRKAVIEDVLEKISPKGHIGVITIGRMKGAILKSSIPPEYLSMFEVNFPKTPKEGTEQ